MKFRYLDGLRGLAALVVVLDHFAISFFQRSTDASIQVHHTWLEEIVLQTPLHLLVSGNFSVAIFFVISGFVLGIKFFGTGQRHVVVSSAWRRYARLELPVLASVLLSYLAISSGILHNQTAAAITGSSWLHDLWNVTPTFLGALYHATIGVFVDAKSQYNTVLWTMQTELVGSFLAFALMVSVGKWRYRWAVYGLLTVALINSYLICFVIGLALCDWYVAYGKGFSLKKRWWIPLLAVSLLLGSIPVGTLVGTAYAGLPEWLGAGMAIPHRLHIFGAIGLLFVLLGTPALQKIVSQSKLLYIGRVSFGLYLTHLLVLGIFSCWAFILLEPVVGYMTGFAIVFAASAFVMWAVAHAFTRWIDEPAMRFASLLYQRHFPKRWKPSIEPVSTVP
ncbi:MAG TPA: acyltransferase [Candidatus Saccharimonadales bacterium]|nr:acyltransferase [Candidatus Saccharimonadales bacterium]